MPSRFDPSDDRPTAAAARWGRLLVDSPWRLFLAVLGVATVVEAGQGALRELVLPDLSGLAGVAVDVLWLPTLLGVLLWRMVVRPLHHELAAEVDDIRSAESALRERTDQLLFDSQLRRAMDQVEDESTALRIVARAVAQAAPEARSRLLLPLAGSRDLHEVAGHDRDDVGACRVAQADGCPVVRSGHATTYRTTDALDTCPALHDSGEVLGATCQPVTVLGETIGVLTTTFPGDDVPDDSVRTNLASVAARAGARLSLLRALHESRRQASTDALTGLVNRRALHAAHEEAARVGTGPSVLLCDLDHFKLLNDTHGHEAGDAALVAFADLARSVVRPGDTAARIGGEEFAVLLPDTDVVQAVGVAERLRRAQAESGGRVSTTVSIGVAGPHTGPGLEDRLRQADVALYAAKEAGRDTVVVAGPDGPVLADHDAVYGIMDAMSADDRHHAWRPMSDSGSTRSARSAG